MDDLTQIIEIQQQDEIGILVKALNTMASTLREMFREILEGVGSLSMSAADLSAISEQVSTSSGETSAKSSSVDKAAEEMSSSSNHGTGYHKFKCHCIGDGADDDQCQ